MLYQKRDALTGEDIGSPAPLPAAFEGLSDKHLAKLHTLLDPKGAVEIGFSNVFFVPVEPEPVPPRVPREIPMYKVEKLLIKNGMIDQVEAALDAIPGLQGQLARVDWKRAPNLVMNSPLVLGIAQALGLDAAQMAALALEAEAMP